MAVGMVIYIMTAESRQAGNVVEEFYRLEQEGKYSSSWELLHSSMHNRFTREAYIQDRSHVFINHFGVTTFEFTLTKPKRLDNWQKHEDAELLDVYHLIATKEYRGKYGYFEFVQYVYVAREDDEWKILWDYRKDPR